MVVSGFDCKLKLKVTRRLLSVKTRMDISSFTRTVHSMLRKGRASLDFDRTRRVIGTRFTRVRGRTRTTTVRRNRVFLGVGGRHPNIIALPDNLRCRMLTSNANHGPGTASGMHYRCRNHLISNALFSDSVRHNRPTMFNIGRIVTK